MCKYQNEIFKLIFLKKKHQILCNYLFVTGGVYYVNESAQLFQRFSLGNSIIKLLYFEEKNVLVTLTENLLLTQHTVMPEGETKELLKVLFSHSFLPSFLPKFLSSKKTHKILIFSVLPETLLHITYILILFF